jgi:hypothetical protein
MRHRDERDLWLVFATWFAMAAPQIAALEVLEKQDHVTHACELETSMILRIRPELVRMDLARGANFDFGSAFYTPDSSGPSRVTVVRPFEHVSATGALSHPEAATAQKGEALYEVAARELVAFVRPEVPAQDLRSHHREHGSLDGFDVRAAGPAQNGRHNPGAARSPEQYQPGVHARRAESDPRAALR